jgi:hypothetical protein
MLRQGYLFAEAYQRAWTYITGVGGFLPTKASAKGGRDELDPLPRPGHYDMGREDGLMAVALVQLSKVVAEYL